jgi:hypothetical protein
MAADLGALLDTLITDPWRAKVGFTEEVSSANNRLFEAREGDAARMVISEWIGQHQPCLFGRMAARADLIEFCILSEADLRGDRTALRDKIQEARKEWLALGHDGLKSAFVTRVSMTDP